MIDRPGKKRKQSQRESWRETYSRELLHALMRAEEAARVSPEREFLVMMRRAPLLALCFFGARRQWWACYFMYHYLQHVLRKAYFLLIPFHKINYYFLLKQNKLFEIYLISSLNLKLAFFLLTLTNLMVRTIVALIKNTLTTFIFCLIFFWSWERRRKTPWILPYCLFFTLYNQQDKMIDMFFFFSSPNFS